MDQIEAILQFDPMTEYIEWKRQCKTIISKIKPLVISTSEEQLGKIYHFLGENLKNDLKTESESNTLRCITKIAIISYFQGSIEAVKPYLKFFENNFQRPHHLIAHCSGKVMYWIAKQSANNSIFSESIINGATDRLKNDKMRDMWFNSMVILAFAAKSMDNEVLYQIRELTGLILHIIFSADLELQTISLKAFKYYVSQMYYFFNKPRTAQTFSETLELLKSDNSIGAYGAAKVIKIYFKYDSVMASSQSPETANALIYAIGKHSMPADYFCCKFLLKLLKTQPISIDCDQLVGTLIKKPINYVHLLEKSILYFKTKLNINQVLEFFKIHELTCKGNFCPFMVLHSIYQINPDIDFVIKPSLDNLCRHFCQCIELKPSIFTNDMIPKIKDYFKYENNMSDYNTKEELRISAIMIVRQFPTLFYKDEDDYINDLSKFFLCKIDEIRKETTISLSKIESSRSLDTLIAFANLDKSKKVRLCAIENIKPSLLLASKIQIYQCHNDSCFRVRRKAIELTRSIQHFNHIEIDPLVWQCYNKLTILLVTSRDARFSAKIASLFPILFTKVNKMFDSEQLATYTISLALRFLGPPDKKYTNIPMQMIFGINQLEIYNMLSSNDTPRKARIDRIVRLESINKRDGYLIETLANLGKLTEPYLNEILETFCYIFETRKSNSLLLKAVNSLIRLSAKLFHGLNIRLRCPQIITPLLNIAQSTNNNELGIAILKLFGAAFDSIERDVCLEAPKIQFNPEDTYFYTDHVISTFLSLFNEPLIPFYDTLTIILESDSKYAAKYIPRIVPLFMKGIEGLPSKCQDRLFSHMEVLPVKFKDDIEPLLEDIMPFIIRHIKLTNCVRFTSALSFYLGFAFNKAALSIYYTCVSEMCGGVGIEHFREVVRLNALMVIRQNQSIEFFLNQIENNIKNFSKEQLTEIEKVLTGIVQNFDARMYKSRLALLAEILFMKEVDVSGLAMSLAVVTKVALSFFTGSGMIKEHIEDIKKILLLSTSQNDDDAINVREFPFIPNRPIVFEFKPLCPQFVPPKTYFSDVKNPDELTIASKWISSLLHNVVSKSPSPTIRAFNSLITSINANFCHQTLLPIAFYSCWNVAESEDRDHFSNIVQFILTRFSSKIPEIIFTLMELVDRWSEPMNVDDLTVAKLSHSHQYTVLLLERHLKRNPNDVETIDLLMNTYYRMGRISTIRALFQQNERIMDRMTIAKWCGKLGNWERALQIYRDVNAPIGSIVHCLACLRRAHEIVAFSPKDIENLPPEEQGQVIHSLVWAFHFKGNEKMINELMNYSSSLKFDPSNLIVYIFFELGRLKFDRAQNHIDSAFRMLNEWRDVLNSGDTNRISRLHHYSQIFVEAEEGVKMKKKQNGKANLNHITEKWEHRIKGFKRETSSWEMFLVLRNIVLPINENPISYMKIISNLRKYKQFILILDYFTKAFDRSFDLRVLFERIKVIWTAGQNETACMQMMEIANLLQKGKNLFSFKKIMNINNFIYYQNSFLNNLATCSELCPNIHKEFVQRYATEDLMQIYQNNEALTNDMKNSIINKFTEKYFDEIALCQHALIFNNTEPKFISHIFRVAGSYISQLFDFSYENLKKAESYFKSAVDLTPDNYKCWKWWAYTNAKLFFIIKNNNNYRSIHAGSDTSPSSMQPFLSNNQRTIPSTTSGPIRNSSRGNSISAALAAAALSSSNLPRPSSPNLPILTTMEEKVSNSEKMLPMPKTSQPKCDIPKIDMNFVNNNNNINNNNISRSNMTNSTSISSIQKKERKKGQVYLVPSKKQGMSFLRKSSMTIRNRTVYDDEVLLSARDFTEPINPRSFEDTSLESDLYYYQTNHHHHHHNNKTNSNNNNNTNNNMNNYNNISRKNGIINQRLLMQDSRSGSERELTPNGGKNSERTSMRTNNNYYYEQTCCSSKESASSEVYDDIGIENAFSFAINAINGFLKATEMDQKMSLSYLCKMFSVVFSLNISHGFPQFLCSEIEQLPTNELLKVVPQITAHIDHKDKSIRSMISSILYKLGEENFQQIFFPLKLYSVEEEPLSATKTNTLSDDNNNANNNTNSNINDNNTNTDNNNSIKNASSDNNNVNENVSANVNVNNANENLNAIKNNLNNNNGFNNDNSATSEENGEPRRGMSTNRAKIASEILSLFKLTKAAVFEDADIFTDGMIRSAITWFESWIGTIENIIRFQKNDQKEKIIEILRRQFLEYENPKCDLDKLFQQLYQSVLNDIKAVYTVCTPIAEKKTFDLLRNLYQSLKIQMSRLSCIVLEKVSRELTAKRHFSLLVPGENERMFSVDPILDVIGTQQRPRCLFINSENGNKYKYLLKGNEDIRVDERLMQFFTLVNTVLTNNRRTREFSPSFISCYTVIPLTNKVGLIGWVTNADTMHQLIKDCRMRRGIDQQIENVTIEALTAGVPFASLSFLQRLEMFYEVKDLPFAQCEEINDMLWMRSNNAAGYLITKRRFTSTSALMSMVGYVIGLGDRHPSNIMIQKDSGNIVHIDFGESFESAIMRTTFPEKVPFRLTRMIINALEGKTTGGFFSECCNTYMSVMRENQNILTAQLAIFADDPVLDPQERGSANRRDENLHRKIYDKLCGYKTGEKGQIETVAEQVERLIEQAENPENYIQHYPGWCPFW